MNISDANNTELKRALEALRNGVPNRDAVRFLGCGQAAAEDRFRAQLAAVEPRLLEIRQPEGMLILGGFGAGKSHVLEYLQHIALEQNFVSSRVVISKETPLYDLGKVYAAAVESAVVPGSTGAAIQEVALKLRQDSPRYAEFFHWANSQQSEIAPIFPATLLLWERLRGDPEMQEDIVGFWGGQKLPIARVRSGLRQIGQPASYNVKTVRMKDLAAQRFRFASRLIRAAGYRGWILLIDEVEMIGRYSLLQRAHSYAELARWMGQVENQQCPGLTAVAAIVDSFVPAVLRGKEDKDLVGARLRAKDTDEARAAAARAETGMRIIERETVELTRPDKALLDQTYRTLKEIHSAAYGWDPPDVPSAERSHTRAMRSHVRRWINEWDLKRVFPDTEVRTEEEKLTFEYTETADLETPSDAGMAADDDPDA